MQSCTGLEFVKNSKRKENYKPISLANTIKKVLDKFFQMEFQRYVNKRLHHKQIGFTPESKRV